MSERKEYKFERLYLNPKCHSSTFRENFSLILDELVTDDDPLKMGYEVNDVNREVLNQIYYYFKGNRRKFKGSHNKGLLITGGYGTGKTTIVKAIKEMIYKYDRKTLVFVSCVNLPEIMKQKDLEYFRRRPMILDEMGRESQVVKDFGTERKLVPEILSMRYNHKAWTFATSNFTLQDLEKLYGGYISDRMKEMFNILELTGKSFRK